MLRFVFVRPLSVERKGWQRIECTFVDDGRPDFVTGSFEMVISRCPFPPLLSIILSYFQHLSADVKVMNHFWTINISYTIERIVSVFLSKFRLDCLYACINECLRIRSLWLLSLRELKAYLNKELKIYGFHLPSSFNNNYILHNSYIDHSIIAPHNREMIRF